MYRTTVDLNCDMGEGFGHWTYGDAPDADLMPLISSANVAAGFHGGRSQPDGRGGSTRRRTRRGPRRASRISRSAGFGRRTIGAKPEELVNDMLYQIGALREFGRRHGVPLQHVKPHGMLYMVAAKDAELSQQLVEALQKTGPDLFLYCMGISETYRIAKEAGQPVIREFYADRDYDNSGSIVFARKMRPLEPEEMAEKCLRACQEGKVRTVEGDDIEVPFESICFHSDTPGALAIGTAVRKTLSTMA